MRPAGKQILFESAYPVTFDTSAWHAPAGFAVLALIAALALFGFRTSLGGRRLLDSLSTES